MKNLLYILFFLPVLAIAQTQPRANQIRFTPSSAIVGTNVQTAIDEVAAEKAAKNFVWITKTSNYTPIATDTVTGPKAFMMRSASAISFTVPPFSTTNFRLGTAFTIYNDSTGTLSLLEGAGVTFETTQTGPWTLAEDEYAVVIKSNLTNTWKLMVGNPSSGGMTNPMTTAADVIVGGASGTPARLAAGTGLQYLRMNAGATALEWATFAGGGIANSAANTELGMSDGTDIVPSGFFVPSAGSLNAGTGLTGTNRTFTAAGSGSNVDWTFTTKGASSFYITQASNLYLQNVSNLYMQGTSTPTMWVGGDGGTVGYVKGGSGTAGQNNGADLEAIAGQAYQVSGNGIGGDMAFSPGIGRGSGADGNIIFNSLEGWTLWVNGNLTPGALSNSVATYTQDVSANAEWFVKNEAGIITQLSGYKAGTLDVDASDVGNVTTGEDNLYSYTLPAGTLAVNEQRLMVRVAGQNVANGNNKRVKIKFGATNIMDPGINGITGSWIADCEIVRTGAATQKCNCQVVALSGTHTVLSDMTETLSGTVVIAVTGEAVATNDIVKESVSVTYQP